MVRTQQRMVDLDRVINHQLAAIRADRIAHTRGVRGDGHLRSYRRLVQPNMPLILSKQHMGRACARADERDRLAVQLDRGAGALQPGQLALLIGDVIFAAALVQRCGCNKVDLLLIAARKLLLGGNRQPNILFHVLLRPYCIQ